MIRNDFSTFIDAYKKADPEVRSLIDAPDITIFVDKLLEKNKAWIPFRNDLVNLIVDIVLGTISLRAAMDTLQTDQETAKLYTPEFSTEIESYIHDLRASTKISDKENDKIGKIIEEANMKQPVIISMTQPQSGVKSEATAQATTTSDESAVKPIRTFAMDVDVSRAHGYGAFRSGEEDDGDEPVHRSSQDDIIKK